MQTYSLQESKLLDPSHNHPSPPTVFAISYSFHLLLSASVFPPTIHLTNLLFNTPPILLRPQCSQSAVTTAAFHPERPNVFLLAFTDGACATYDATRLFHDGGIGERRLGPASSGAGAETMFIKNVHAMSNIVPDSALKETQGYEASSSAAVIGSKSLGITAAAFVPGFKSRFVTVGQDGKCCVIDIAVPGKKEARIVHSWHVRSPATSLSITPFNHDHGVFGHNDIQASEEARNAVKRKPLIAIGCQDSRVLLFDLGGNQLGGETFHPDGTRVVDVEWMSGEDTTERKRSKSGHGMPQTPPFKAKKKSVGSVLGRGRAETEEILSIMDGADEMVLVPARDSSVRDGISEEPNRQRDLANTALNHTGLFSPIKVLPETKTAKRKMSRKHERDSEGSEATIKAIRKPVPRIADDALNDTHTKHFDGEQLPKPSTKRDPIPSIPQRPAPGKVNDVLAFHAETVPEPMSRQSTTAEGSTAAQGLVLSAPYMKPNMITVPTSTGHPKKKASVDKSNAPNTASTEAIDEGLWTDIAPEPHQPTQAASRKPFAKPSKSHNKSIAFHPPSSGPSEASNDTVIDWAAASSRPPNSLIVLPPSTKHTKASRKFKKGHISLSRSSTSHDTMVQWSSFKKNPDFNIHNDLCGSTRQLPSSSPSPTNLPDFPPVQSLREATHSSKVNPESALSQTNTPSLVAPPIAPAFNFSSPQLQTELATARVKLNHDGGLQQPDNTRPPHTQEPPTLLPPQAEPPGSMDVSSILQRELQALRADLKEHLARQLAVQRSWFDAQLAASWDERRALEEENRVLRRKLAVESKSRTRGW